MFQAAKSYYGAIYVDQFLYKTYIEHGSEDIEDDEGWGLEEYP